MGKMMQLISIALFACAIVAFFGILGASIWNFVKKHIAKGIINIIMIPVCSVITIFSMLFSILFFCDYSNSANNKLAEKNYYNNEIAASMLESARHIGRFAELPDSKTDFKIATEGSPFTRSYYITFKAPLKDIEKFIHDSPGLKDAEPKIYSREYMLIEYESYDDEPDHRHGYFFRREGTPEWYTPGIKIKGRNYQIPYKEGYGIGGSLTVNDEEETVYIYVSWS